MTNEEREVLLKRLQRAAQQLSNPALDEVTRLVESRAAWEVCIAKARDRAKGQREQHPFAVLLNYDHDWIPFAEAIGLPRARATKFWTHILKVGRTVGSPERRDGLLAVEISVQFLRSRFHDLPRLNEGDRLLIEVWLLNLGWKV